MRWRKDSHKPFFSSVMRLLKLLLVFIFIYAAFALAGFLFPIDQSWYDSLDKPALAPTGTFIGMVWGILFGLIALAYTWAFHRRGSFRMPAGLWILIILNYIFNQMFSYFQFSQKDLLFAAIDCGFTALTTISLVLVFGKISKLSTLLLLPYMFWTLFATYLAFKFYMLNPNMTMFQ
ncbi:tryptophan-rich sensory protein [Halobacillus rhizosphaerae]|uniref:TspO/MBR family protein n=1 Tax=Halobacillus rhizosphaerae TaxID=3064889 RepID=UPI00398B1C83